MPTATVTPSVPEQLAALVRKRHEAEERVEQLEADGRAASVQLRDAREQLVEHERRGDGSAADRKRLEDALAEAARRQGEPWGERVEGARRGVRDAQQQYAVFVRDNLDALLVEPHERARLAAQALSEAAQAVVTAYVECGAAGQQISALAGVCGPMRPGDVSQPGAYADALHRAATDMLLEGGATAPTLRRDPRHPEHEAVA